MPSVIKQLTEEQLEHVHRMLRRGALTQAEIAVEAGKMLGRAIAATPAQAGKLLSKYAHSRAYLKWRDRVENQEREIRIAVETQREKYLFLAGLFQGSTDGLNAVSKGLQARLLAACAELPDDKLQEAAPQILKVIRVVQEQEKVDRAALAEQLDKIASDPKLSPEERRARIRELVDVGAQK